MSSTDHPASIKLYFTWFVVVLSASLLLLGVYWYGLSVDVRQRFWGNIAERIHGPMTFRFILQPAMALIAAVIDGINDVRHGHKSFFWTAQLDPTQHAGRIREGMMSIARVILLGICMDVIYQIRVFDEFYPAEAAMMALLLAVIPYFIFRWVVELAARWWFGGTSPGQAS